MMRVTQSITFMGGHGRAVWDPADKVEIGDRRRVPREILVQIRGGKNEPDLGMKIEVREGIPQWVEVTLRARPDGPEVRDKHLAAIHLGDWLNQVVAACSLGLSGVDPDGTVWSKPVDDQSAVGDIRRA